MSALSENVDCCHVEMIEVRRVDMLHVMSRGHIPATQTNRDSNRDKILSRSDHPKASETYRRGDEIDVFEYEVQFLCWTAASVCALSSHIFWRSNYFSFIHLSVNYVDAPTAAGVT